MGRRPRTSFKRPRHGDIARRAFDVVAEIGAVTSLDMLQQTAVKGFAPLGYDMCIGFDSVAADGSPAVNILFGKEHGKWEPHYLTTGLQQHDPIIKATKASLDPFFWSDALAGKDLEKNEQRVMDEAAEFGLLNGFVTPMHNPDGSITAVLLSGGKIDARDPDLRSASHLMSLYFGAMGRRLHRTGVKRAPVRLSRRQLDCLNWVREGKSSTDIGEILGLSSRTVDEHVALACARLGVRTRTQAVVEAATHGLIKL